MSGLNGGLPCVAAYSGAVAGKCAGRDTENRYYMGENTVFLAPNFFFFDFLISLGLLVIEMRDIGIGSV